MKKYNKLVRDKIPRIIKDQGRTPIYHTADLTEHKQRLYNKMEEELQEFQETPCVEEIADMYEVLLAIAETHGIDIYDIILTANRKREERGGFCAGFVLETVDK